jgi:hypothetical protein
MSFDGEEGRLPGKASLRSSLVFIWVTAGACDHMTHSGIGTESD